MHPRIATDGVRCADYDRDWVRLFQAIGELIDLEAVERLFAEWPAAGSLDQKQVAQFAPALPRAAMWARFSAFVSGRNR